jgi:hypothetical protein
MKRILVLTFLISAGTVAFAQKEAKTGKNDPTYSVHNYKHPNKAAWAAKNKKEGITLDNATVGDNSDYKHTFARKSRKKAVASPYKGNGYPASSYKHPLGVAGV